MDLEEMLFPFSIILLISGLVSAALIYVPNIPFPGFTLFVFSVASLISSVVCLVVDLIATWPLEEQTYHYRIFRTQNSPTNVEATPQPQGARLEKLEVAPPTKEQLQALKEALGLKEGSLQYKKRGQGVYHVLYNEGKYRWCHLGSWIQLKEKLETENSVE